MPTKPATKRRAKSAAPQPRGLGPHEVGTMPPIAVTQLREAVEADGGTTLATYREPLGGRWQLLAMLPIDSVQPTPYQRDLSETHVRRLAEAIDKLDRFLDPVIAVRTEQGTYWTPNGHHRLGALRLLGARAITALVVPEPEVAHRILALNTEKAHNVRERALEVSRLEQGLAQLDQRPEAAFAAEFEDPALLTLGLCYQRNGRFSGGAYHPLLKRVEAFLDQPLPQALQQRAARADRLLELDEAVGEAVARIKERGFRSPYLKAFVVARIDPLRFKRGARGDFDTVMDKLIAAARTFDASKVKSDQLASTGGPPED